MKISLKHMNDISRQAVLLTKNNINDLEDLKSFRYSIQEELKKLKRKREGLWRKKSKAKTDDEKDKINAQIKDLGALIKAKGKDITNCYEIENRAILLKNQVDKVKKKERNKEVLKSKKKSKTR